jgi:pimeloyl-ACP methyl ester carboxylesterase
MSRPTEITMLDATPIEYRIERQTRRTVVFFHGGHMHAGIALGEQPFLDEGYTVLVPSRPGYGRTPLSIGATPERFADAVFGLIHHLGFGEVAAVVGISAGGPYAITMAARHPGMVERLILQSSISSLSWPDRKTHIAARVAFNSITGRVSWAAARLFLRLGADRGLSVLLGSLSTESGRRVLEDLDSTERAELVHLFMSMRSGRGFVNDLGTRLDPEIARRVTQPSLVMASRCDGSVPFEHSADLTRLIPNAELFVSDALSHLIWFGGLSGALSEGIGSFLE